MQAILREFVLEKRGEGLLLEVHVEQGGPCIHDSAGKREFFASLAAGGEGGRKLRDELARFHAEPRLLRHRFDCAGHPMRYLSGGVLPIARLDGVDHYCLLYRDIFPVGWNIANGGSENLDEMLRPERILLREFGEELFVFDGTRRLLYAYEPADAEARGSQPEALAALGRQFLEDPRGYRRLSPPLVWLHGPDQVRATVRGRSHTSGGFFVQVVPEDNGIEVDRVARIDLSGDVRFFDGEYVQGRLLDRPVGLFPVAELERHLTDAGRDFLPARLFIGGRPHEGGEAREALAARGAGAGRLDLCPVTRSIIDRYSRWRGEGAGLARPGAHG